MKKNLIFSILCFIVIENSVMAAAPQQVHLETISPGNYQRKNWYGSLTEISINGNISWDKKVEKIKDLVTQAELNNETIYLDEGHGGGVLYSGALNNDLEFIKWAINKGARNYEDAIRGSDIFLSQPGLNAGQEACGNEIKNFVRKELN